MENDPGLDAVILASRFRLRLATFRRATARINDYARAVTVVAVAAFLAGLRIYRGPAAEACWTIAGVAVLGGLALVLARWVVSALRWRTSFPLSVLAEHVRSGEPFSESALSFGVARVRSILGGVWGRARPLRVPRKDPEGPRVGAWLFRHGLMDGAEGIGLWTVTPLGQAVALRLRGVVLDEFDES